MDLDTQEVTAIKGTKESPFLWQLLCSDKGKRELQRLTLVAEHFITLYSCNNTNSTKVLVEKRELLRYCVVAHVLLKIFLWLSVVNNSFLPAKQAFLL